MLSKKNIPDIIKYELMECFIDITDIIYDDQNSGVSITRPSGREYNTLEGYGRPGDYVRVIVKPNLVDIWDYIPPSRNRKGGYPSQEFTDLSYTPAKVNSSFYDELINSIYLSESTGFKVNCIFVAWSNGGEYSNRRGEIITKFKFGGSDPMCENNQYSDYDIDKLEWFLKTKIRDRIRWIKIFYF